LFSAFTVGTWLLLGTGGVALHFVLRSRAAPSSALPLRVAAFASLVTFGTLVGFSGLALAESEAFFLAVPGALALGWLFVANPVECGCAENSPHKGSSGPGAP
jgi:hypothetical protein